MLTALAERLQPALFVMGAQEPQGLLPWLFGGNTEQLVARLPSPVLACA
jgi:nucleotide-binding universal stress UspA family protein